MNSAPRPETEKTIDVGRLRCFGLLGAVVVFHACVQVLAIGLGLLQVRHTSLVAAGILGASLAAAPPAS